MPLWPLKKFFTRKKNNYQLSRAKETELLNDVDLLLIVFLDWECFHKLFLAFFANHFDWQFFISSGALFHILLALLIKVDCESAVLPFSTSFPLEIDLIDLSLNSEPTLVT